MTNESIQAMSVPDMLTGSIRQAIQAKTADSWVHFWLKLDVWFMAAMFDIFGDSDLLTMEGFLLYRVDLLLLVWGCC